MFGHHEFPLKDFGFTLFKKFTLCVVKWFVLGTLRAFYLWEKWGHPVILLLNHFLGLPYRQDRMWTPSINTPKTSKDPRFIMESPIKMDNWGVPPFLETPICLSFTFYARTDIVPILFRQDFSKSPLFWASVDASPLGL